MHVIYTNQKITDEDWHTYEVGKTQFNDEALRRAGEYLQERFLMFLTMSR
jgi:hypothetical protein